MTAHLYPLAVSLMHPFVVLVLCAAAGVGTVMALPSARENSIRKIGGIVLLAVGLIFAAVLVRAAAGAPADDGVGVYFWIFSAIAVAAAFRVVTHARPVYSALYFVLTVMASAGLFILMAAEFMAAALVLIYAGAILVTYVFVIMLAAQAAPTTDQNKYAAVTDYDAISREPFWATAVGFVMMGVILLVIFDKADGLTSAADADVVGDSVETATLEVQGSTQELGAFLFNHQLVNLELAGLILTVAMVGAIVISRGRVVGGASDSPLVETVTAAATPVDDDPHSIPVYGTDNPRQKAFPET